MANERQDAPSRLRVLAENMKNKRYRDAYVSSHTRHVLAQQMRQFRGDLSQQEFGKLIDKRQTVISRLENPSAGAWQLRTMLEIARKRDVAVLCRFVDFPTFLKYADDLSEESLAPLPYDESEVDAFVQREDEQAERLALLEALMDTSSRLESGSFWQPTMEGRGELK